MAGSPVVPAGPLDEALPPVVDPVPVDPLLVEAEVLSPSLVLALSVEPEPAELDGPPPAGPQPISVARTKAKLRAVVTRTLRRSSDTYTPDRGPRAGAPVHAASAHAATAERPPGD